MNVGRIWHLLFFELKRLKWLIVVAWVSLVVAFVPRLCGAVGLWNSEWHSHEKSMSGGGMIGFGITGIFIAIWAGLFGVKLIPTRPIRKGETLVVRLGVLLGVLVVPVLVLTLLSLWLHGFRGALIWKNLGAVALATVPLWVSLGFLARLAGSVRVMMVGLATLWVIFVVGDASPLRGLWAAWPNVVGSFLTVPVLTVAWVTAGLLMLATMLAKNWVVSKRLALGVCCVLVGSLTMLSSRSFVETSPEMEFSEAVRFTGESRLMDTSDGTQIDFVIERGSQSSNRFVTWRVLGELKGENGVRLVNHYNPRGAMTQVGQGSMLIEETSPGQRILKDGTVYATNRGSFQRVIDQQLETPSVLSCMLIDGVVGDKIEGVSGKIVGEMHEVVKLVETRFQKEVEFRGDDFLGEIEWVSPRGERFEPEIRVQMKGSILIQEGDDSSRGFPAQKWIFHLCYLKSGVVIEGSMNGTGRDGRIGGVQGWSQWVTFNPRMVRDREEMWEEEPVLRVYEVQAVERGYCEVTLPTVEIQAPAQGSVEYRSILEGNQERTMMPTSEMWKSRPGANTATRAEIGGWMRMIHRTFDYGGKARDLADYAGGFGDLLIESGRKGGGAGSQYEEEAFLNGGDDKWWDELIAALGEVEWAPRVIVSRGWGEESRAKVEELIASGNRDEEILKLGVLLEIGGIAGAVFEKLESSDDVELYEIARTLSAGEVEFEEALDRRLEYLDRRSRSDLSYAQEWTGFGLRPWVPLLKQGREKDLKRLLDWVGRFVERGKVVHSNDEFSQVVVCERDFEMLAKAQKLGTGFFLWDPVLRRWNFNEKGKLE